MSASTTRSPVTLPLLEFLALSAGSLLLELFLIRYLSAEIRIFAYFSNLVLVICFLGLGLGYAVDRPRIPIAWTFVATTVLVVLCQEWASPWLPFRAIPDYLSFADFNTWNEIERDAPRIMAGVALLSFVLLVVAVAFVPIGQALGQAFAEEPPESRLALYSWNVGASLFGVLAFQGLTLLWLPPSAWVSASLLAVLLGARRRGRDIAIGLVSLSICVACTLPATSGTTRVFWSPYQKLELRGMTHVERVPGGATERTPFFALTVNSTIYQYLLDFRREFVRARPATFPPQIVDHLYYELPYRVVPSPASVLVVGAGTGNDVAAALRNGARHVDAVEIDPTILEIGKVLHPESPYADPRVHAVVADARAFFHRTDRRYDLIVFGLLDSHRLSSNFSNTSLDSYVYTLESLRTARSLLTEEGVLSLSFQMSRFFIAERLYESLHRVFGVEPVVLHSPQRRPVHGIGGTLLFAGAQDRIRAAVASSPELRAHHATMSNASRTEPATDDWPHLYVERRAIPMLWRIVGGAVVVGVVLCMLPVGLRAGRFDSGFFWLGFAFMLLETQAVSRFALAYGATWSVAVAVISGILLMILIGNGIVEKTRVQASYGVLAALIVTAAFGAWLPVDRLAAAGPAVRAALLGVSVAPLLFAAIAFARGLEGTPNPRAALLSNLLGAVAGGLAQCLTFVIGQQALVWLIICAYVGAWLLLGRRLSLQRE